MIKRDLVSSQVTCWIVRYFVTQAENYVRAAIEEAIYMVGDDYYAMKFSRSIVGNNDGFWIY